MNFFLLPQNVKGKIYIKKICFFTKQNKTQTRLSCLVMISWLGKLFSQQKKKDEIINIAFRRFAYFFVFSAKIYKA